MKFLSNYFHIFILVTHNRDIGFTFGVAEGVILANREPNGQNEIWPNQ